MEKRGTRLRPAIFFDRDGTLNVDTHYLYKPEEFRWIKDAPAALRWANDHGYLTVVVTNQSGVARGFYTEEDVEKLHRWMNERLGESGAHIDAFYYCPHHPEGTVAKYRKNCDSAGGRGLPGASHRQERVLFHRRCPAGYGMCRSGRHSGRAV